MSRRQLLASASAATAVALLPGCRSGAGSVIDVRSFGARGDGVTDDSQAIQAAVAALRSHQTLRFPTGSYRFAERNPRGAAAIVLAGVADVTVEFAPGAELLMDNLNPAGRTGTSHGVLVSGPAARIALRNVHVRWAADATRSLGDGIRVQGSAGPRAPVSGISLSDCVVRSSPQAGVIMMGASDISVTGLRVADTRADGLHFNGCRRAKVDDYRAAGTGDDGLALVTYFATRSSFDRAAGTFAFPTLTEWSNTDFSITGVEITGGDANGVRIAGAQRVSVEDLRVTGLRSGAAVLVDSAAPGADAGWHYVASHAVRLAKVTATDCDTGMHVLARPGTAGDRLFTDFDVHADNTTFDGCSNWSVRAESLTEHTLSGVRVQNCRISATSTTGGNGGVGIGNARGISLLDLSIEHTEQVRTFHTDNAGQLTVDRLTITQP